MAFRDRWETNGADLQPSVQHESDEEYQELVQAIEVTRLIGCLDESVLDRLQIPYTRPTKYELAPNEFVRPSTVSSSSKGMEYGQIAPSKVSFPVLQSPPPEINVKSSPPKDIELLSPVYSYSHDILANPSRPPLSSPTVTFPSPPPLFRRPSNISENPEWSHLWLITPPLRKMVPLPTYHVQVVSKLNGSTALIPSVNKPESTHINGLGFATCE